MSSLEDLQNQILDLRYRTERLESLSRHSLKEHYDDVVNYWVDHFNVAYNPNGMVPVMWFFTAYERWLNNRQLLSEVAGD